MEEEEVGPVESEKSPRNDERPEPRVRRSKSRHDSAGSLKQRAESAQGTENVDGDGDVAPEESEPANHINGEQDVNEDKFEERQPKKKKRKRKPTVEQTDDIEAPVEDSKESESTPENGPADQTDVDATVSQEENPKEDTNQAEEPNKENNSGDIEQLDQQDDVTAPEVPDDRGGDFEPQTGSYGESSQEPGSSTQNDDSPSSAPVESIDLPQEQRWRPGLGQSQSSSSLDLDIPSVSQQPSREPSGVGSHKFGTAMSLSDIVLQDTASDTSSFASHSRKKNPFTGHSTLIDRCVENTSEFVSTGTPHCSVVHLLTNSSRKVEAPSLTRISFCPTLPCASWLLKRGHLIQSKVKTKLNLRRNNPILWPECVFLVCQLQLSPSQQNRRTCARGGCKNTCFVRDVVWVSFRLYQTQ